jgi:phosphatidylserine/phosphatidylglycerophosphate/cardiolipin synthase-like enzyme
MAQSFRYPSSKRPLAAIFLALWLGVGTWHVFKPMPAGTDVRTPPMQIDAADVEFLADLTFTDAQGVRRSEQEIFDAIWKIIDESHSFIVADFFLFNDLMGSSSGGVRPLSAELTAHLIARKAANPQLRVLLMTDPVNEIYGGTRSHTLDELRRAGIDVVTTDLRRLRDSNPAYSALWRMGLQWWGNEPNAGVLPNPFGNAPPHITLRSWLDLLNFKANHRKVIVADRADTELSALVTSANPHDASSRHSNVALQFSGALAARVAASEMQVARFSGWQGQIPLPDSRPTAAPLEQTAQLTFMTESAIREHLLEAIDGTRSGDVVRLATFYLSDRPVIDSLLCAAARGVAVRLVLDPNKDAFGREKDGVPNRPVANELVSASKRRIQVRWYKTDGEQFHTKLALISHGERLIASLGSANLTRRNLGNYNLEANVALEMARSSTLASEMSSYFERIWDNRAGEYTVQFAVFHDDDPLRYWRYRIMEATGLSTF